jgi:hypothetical protein
MYRSLIIGLGESLRPVCRHLDAAVERDVASHPERDVQVSTLRLFQHGGSSDKGGPFDEQLREQALAELTELLGMTARQTSSSPWLDIFVLFDLDEEGPRSVLRASVEELTALVRENFEAIFPSFRRNGERRVRIVPVTITGAHGASNRDPMLADLRSFESWIAERHDPEQHDEDCLVDRCFVLDGVTPQGLVPKEDLLVQTANLLELTLLGGRRREEPFTSLFDYGGAEIGATFASALWRLDADNLQGRLAQRLASEIVERLLDEGASTNFDIDLADHVLESGELFEEYLDRIERLPEETFRNRGPSAVVALSGRYGRLLDECQQRRSNLENERDGLQDKLADDGDEETTSTSSGGGSGLLESTLGSLVLGGIVFGLAAFGFGLAIFASAIASGGISLLGAVALYFLLQSAPEPSTDGANRRENSTTERRLDEVDTQLERLERLRQSLREHYTSMHALEEALRALEPENKRIDMSGGAESFDLEANLPLRETFHSDALEDAIFETSLPYNDLETAKLEFVHEHVDPLPEWEEGDRIDRQVLDDFTQSAFDGIRSADLFEHREVRETIEADLRDFVEDWRDGMPLFLDLRSRRQYDPDGFLSPFDQSLIVPDGLESLASDLVDEVGAPLDVRAGLEQGDRAYLLHTVVDIHPRAMPQPSEDFDGTSDESDDSTSSNDSASDEPDPESDTLPQTPSSKAAANGTSDSPDGSDDETATNRSNEDNAPTDNSGDEPAPESDTLPQTPSSKAAANGTETSDSTSEADGESNETSGESSASNDASSSEPATEHDTSPQTPISKDDETTSNSSEDDGSDAASEEKTASAASP